MSAIKDLKPQVVWNNFDLLTKCPRPSKHEEIVREFLLKWGKEKGIETFADKAGNVIMRVPATPGFENRKGVILQAHMDMVPQKIASSNHDFLKDPIETIIDGEWVKANGTTLGADDGLGVAMAMAVCEDKTVKHGPVEVLITYDEETGMSGAENFEPGVLNGDILINVDSEDEKELCIGCAGGLDVIAKFAYNRVAAKGYVGYKLAVKGLQGGHSGMDISLYRGNANKIMAYTILPAMKEGAQLVSFTGGSLRNAIPFEAEVVIAVPSSDAQKAEELFKEGFEIAKNIYKESDPSLAYSIEKVEAPVDFIETAVALNVVKSVIACPSNVIRMSQSMAGLTETSINLAIVRTEKDHIRVAGLMRSAVDAAKAQLAERVRIIFELAGAEVSLEGGYSGWVPKPETPMIKKMDDIYRKMYGEGMDVAATHGGLECALLGAKYPHWEMVSIGPTIRYPHSPDERAKISSVQKTWDFLKEVLVNIDEK